MKSVAVENANLAELLKDLPGEYEIFLTNGPQPIAKLTHMPKPAPRATPEQLAKRRQALEELRTHGGLTSVIPNPSDWQREIREDRPLPGRE